MLLKTKTPKLFCNLQATKTKPASSFILENISSAYLDFSQDACRGHPDIQPLFTMRSIVVVYCGVLTRKQEAHVALDDVSHDLQV